jgi:hypothetical protein
MALLFSNPHSKKIFIILQTGILFFLAGCSGLEKSEQDKLRENNAKGEYVYRNHKEVAYPVAPPRPREREAYPWEGSGEAEASNKK